MRLLSLFSGIGAFEMALKNIKIEYELVGFSEIDKYAIKSYCSIHNVNESLNLGDITKIDIELLQNNIDIITHGSPCQDFSIAGRQEGGDKNSNTRSSLMWNTVEIVKHCKPKYVIWENVKNVLSKKHRRNFDKYLKELENLGYTNYYKILNAKDYGVPQNRERVFVVSVLGKHKPYEFPTGFKLTKCLKDILEEKVDSKYYVSPEIQSKFKPNKNIKNDLNSPFRLGGLFDTNNSKHQAGSVWDIEGVSPTLDTMQGGYRQPCIIDNTNVVGKLECEGWYDIKTRVHDTNGISPTMETKNRGKYLDNSNGKIRKLTPRECFRLMGLSENYIDKIQNTGISNTQQYKQAGNSIVVNVLEAIFKNLFLK